MAQQPVPKRAPLWLRLLRVGFVFVVLFALLFGYQSVRLYTDWLWFQELGQRAVFSSVLTAKLTLFLGFGLVFFVVVFSNVRLAMQMNSGNKTPRLLAPEQMQLAEIARKATRLATFALPLVLAVMAGGIASSHWSEYLQFTHASKFGVADPVFGNDLSFYVFRLPFIEYLQGWLLFTLVAASIGAAAIHYSERAIDFIQGSQPVIAPFVRRHLLALLGCIALCVAWGHMLGRYDLLYADNKLFVGAGYTDVHARIPAMFWVQGGLMALTGILCFINISVGKAFRLPIVGLALYVVGTLVATGAYPGMVQKLTVVPNEFDKQKPFIERDIEFTRRAYGLDKVTERIVEPDASLSADDVAEDQATIDNIRLWDWPQLGLVYTVKQALRNYYRFSLPGNATLTHGDYNIDVDRYNIEGVPRQVMVGARELNSDGLSEQAKTWQNLRLQYTHGYGVVMSPVNEVDTDGLPKYYMDQIPVRTKYKDLELTRPQIYYGELTTEYVFTDTKANEFDHPAEKNVENRYNGKGGTAIGGLLSRTAWSIRLADTNMLLSGDLTSKSKLHFRRGIRERVQTLAPFLNWDNDPYIVIQDGKLVWIMDGYTVTNRYPYSKPTLIGTSVRDVDQRFNYIRNSVKATVDAYDGTVTFYVADPSDPMIQTYSRIFPSLFTSMDKMPSGIREHLRYPEDLFRIQRQLYTVYHITDARIYYGKEDQWEVAEDPAPDSERASTDVRRMAPYYVNMRLPGDKKTEFILMTPFTPLDKPNLSAWMSAKCDPADYGKLLVYKFPKGRNVNGPTQVMGQIKSNEDISRYQTLIGQRGSRVIYGNLMVIPVANSLLYAVPLYVQASEAGSAAIPQITQVIVAAGDRVAMRPNLKEALAAAGLSKGDVVAAAKAMPTVGGPGPGAAKPTAPTGTTTSALPVGQADVLRKAQEAFDRARAQQREYDAALDELGNALKALGKPGAAQPSR